MTVQPATYWAVISPMNQRSKRSYIDHSSLSYTRKGAISNHLQWFKSASADEQWKKQRKDGWTVARVTIAIANSRPEGVTSDRG